MKVCVYMFGQDDPNKCTAAKLVRFGLAEQVRYIGHNTVLLDPLSSETLSRQSCIFCNSICAIDCSWERAGYVFTRYRGLRHGKHRRLPAMLAANPTNYSKIGKLSSVEALAGSLFILGHKDRADRAIKQIQVGTYILEVEQ